VQGSIRGQQQGWVLDNLVALGGVDVLHPEVAGFFQEYGYARHDVEAAFSEVKSTPMVPKGWAKLGASLERRAESSAEQYPDVGINLFMRASMAYGRAQYAFLTSDPRRRGFAQASARCVEAMAELNPTPIERVTAPFEGKQISTLLHLAEVDGPAPVVLLLPGMDMVKEEWTFIAQRHFVPRGIHAIALDGPGQGQSLTEGLTVTTDNYERAASAVIDAIVEHPKIDSDRILLWGVSMGAYWGMRVAAHEPRLKAAATTVGFYGDAETIFDRAQPSFKRNFMNMTGIFDEERFDREIMANMPLTELVGKISCPVLMSMGEFDELANVTGALELFEKIDAPKDFVVWEGEFHPLGGVMAEAIALARSFLDRALDGSLAADRDIRAFMRADGEVDFGSGLPSWWPVPDEALAAR
jgi:pimeloyl-ACP methyl ester carboxylesterase